MKRFGSIVLVAMFLLAATLPLRAQGFDGCVDSPENSTALLALLGAAGVCIAQFRGRFSRQIIARLARAAEVIYRFLGHFGTSEEKGCT